MTNDSNSTYTHVYLQNSSILFRTIQYTFQWGWLLALNPLSREHTYTQTDRARQLSGRMPDSQSNEPGFESPFATVSKIGHFRSLHWRPCSLSCINEYLAIDSGGNVSDFALARNCCLARMLPGEAELVSDWTGLSGRAKSANLFERSNGLDTALYKKNTFTFFTETPS